MLGFKKCIRIKMTFSFRSCKKHREGKEVSRVIINFISKIEVVNLFVTNDIQNLHREHAFHNLDHFSALHSSTEQTIIGQMSKITLKTSFIFFYILKRKSIFHLEFVNIFLVQSLEYVFDAVVVCAHNSCILKTF